ncbi:HlyD family efflux transporter periplasmic adaptor subunit [Deinococcus psychrotolerans]|uniref:HlyD family efflux transporter periplasmic adaptor subunit n=1 Tax=Deinococcus psychrotolerans TaxID=2489213 RepID=A0A3G8YE28_9DEIO|nr:efflux RND transporter periplasmic adaptor subunit [Deinococcus psychrotolerans]AZI43225.1 HlyD family efflux transporter periplasmic adaptor subunit [Deinococcus psychrotolerans]
MTTPTSAGNPKRRPSFVRRFWLPALVVISVGITAFAFLRPSGPTGLPVNVVAATTQIFTRTVSGTGSAKAEVARSVNFAVNGNVAQVNVKVGDTVQVGQVLAKLDTAAQVRDLASAQAAFDAAQSDIARAEAAASDAAQDNSRNLTNAQLTRASAEAALRTAEATLASQAKLQALGAVSAQDLQAAQASRDDAARKRDQAEADLRYAKNRSPQSSAASVAQSRSALESARVRLANAGAALTDAELKAPAGGVVSAVGITAGNATASPAVVITDPAQLYLQVPFDETRAPDLKSGQPAVVTFDALPNQTFSGTVARIDPTADASGNAASVVVKIRLPDVRKSGVSKVKPGFTGTAVVTVRRIQDAVTVPIEATLEGEGNTLKVFRVTPGTPKGAQLVGTAQPVTVTQQDRNANLAAVTGLKAGDLIVDTPDPGLKAGSRVLYSAPSRRAP